MERMIARPGKGPDRIYVASEAEEKTGTRCDRGGGGAMVTPSDAPPQRLEDAIRGSQDAQEIRETLMWTILRSADGGPSTSKVQNPPHARISGVTPHPAWRPGRRRVDRLGLRTWETSPAPAHIGSGEDIE